MSEQRAVKNYEELEFRDYFMFGKVMEDPELCHDVLECLLQRPVGKIIESQSEREFRYTSDGKPIRLDIYNRDEHGDIYNTEMQNLNKKSIENHALPQRSRFYQASIDVDFLNRGNHFRMLPESNVIFICTFDPFKLGLSQYTFRERCDENNEVELNDGTTKRFYNCTYKGDDVPEELMMLYEYVETGNADSELTKRIEEAVFKGRQNEKWRCQYLRERERIHDEVLDAVEEFKEELEETKEQLGETKEQLGETKEQLEAANQRIRELEAQLKANH